MNNSELTELAGRSPSKRRRMLGTAAVITLFSCSGTPAALAQGETSAPVEKVVVIATKTGRALRKSAVSASVISAAKIDATHITNIQDIQALAPSLVYNDAANHGEAYIRGVGSNFSLAGAESSVATYVNGAYLQRQTGANLNLIDVDNVQVLNGPQSSLYGRDATGGAIVITTKKPTQSFGGYVSAEGGNEGHYGFSGVLNAPINGDLALRLVGDIQHLDDYITNVGGAGGDLGGFQNYYGRATLTWKPSDNFTATVIGEFSNDANNSYPQHMRVQGPLCLACAIYGLTVPTGFYTVAGSDPGGVGPIHAHDGYQILTRYWSTTLQLNYHAPQYDVTSVSSYRDSDEYGNSEEDRTIANLEYAEVDETGPTFTQDTYLTSHFDFPLNFLVGAFYERERDHMHTELVGDAFGGLPDVAQHYLASIDSVSGYGELNYTILPGLLLSGDLRYNHDNKRGDAQNDAGGEAISGLAGYHQSLQQGDFTPRGVLSYTLPSQYYYASYSIGRKSSFFTTPAFAPLPPLAEETLKEWEIGAKNDFLDGRIKTDISGFYGTWSNIVVQYDDPAVGGIRAQNAASAKTYGFEARADWDATSRLTLGLGISYLHNYFTDYGDAAVYAPNPSGPGLVSATENLSGTVLPRSPKFIGDVNASYSFPFVGGWTGVVSGVGRYTSKFDFISGGGGPLGLDVQHGFFKLDGSITFTDPSEKYSAQFYSTNLTGAKYFTYAATDTLGPFDTPAAPRLFGLRIKCAF